MRPLTLTLTGFIGVRDGMKRDSVTLNLESLPNGLIALTGPNGAGKSTIMDNLHPYRIMPSRATKLSVDGFSYWDHLYGAQALKEFEWEHGGVRYRSSFAFRKPGKTGKAEYFLAWRDSDGKWQPMQTGDGTVSDGKAETYDLCVESVCGSLESFFTSVFSAQNRRPLASYGASEIKALLAELLHIDDLRTLSAQSSEVAKVLGRTLDATQQQLVALGAKRDRLAQIDQAIASDVQSVASTRESREALNVKVVALTDQRALLVAKQTANASAQARLRELATRRSQITAALQTLATDATADDRRFGQRRTSLRATVTEHNAVIAQREAILGAAAARDAAQARVAAEEARIAPIQAAIDVLEAKQLELTSASSRLKGLESEGSSRATLLKALEQQASVIGTVPCAGHEMHNTCPLLAQAREADTKVHEQRISLTNLRTEFRTKRESVEKLTPEVQQLAGKRAELKSVTDQIAAARRDLQKAVDLAARKPLLDAATEGLGKATAELAALDSEEATLRARREAQQSQLANEAKELDAEVARLGVDDVTGAIADIDRQLTQCREAITAAEARIETLIRSQATREVERHTIATDLGSFDATQSRAQRISDEIARWKLLAKGLGNEGVIALTIDDAGPALTKMVNDLLLACYGMRFTVEIQTQRALASGELREGFEILVHDADHDSTKAVTVMSGGQKVWINECLTRGIALYLASNAGQPYQSLFSDESDGPLDPQRKLQFMRMKREVLRQGGYEREFFISQTPDLVAEADAVIDVAALAAA
ncbi:nuclease SbcCD subunit C [Paraburkholderia hospita]|uniref:Nuclease SbcCD subunit C n=1 Tax=Paraburkholderia hospita TaxID=169430 RepID=A0AAN1JK31_9BURK|nr:nuclease SbcCD subunit C [Paraburkholderia hospita]AUT75508.1 nuclease SbcCD subunit C [Paraburkholderia hospita]